MRGRSEWRLRCPGAAPRVTQAVDGFHAWCFWSRLVPWKRGSSPNSRAGHPGWLRGSSLTYAEYARSSRLAIRAPRSGTEATNHASRGTSVVHAPTGALADSVAAWSDPPLPVALAFVLGIACCSRAPAHLDVATTTSVQNSGLLDALLPHFSDATVRVPPAASGRALAMLSDGTVDLVISHAPETETRYLAEHARWVYRKIAFNRFLVIGPRKDPAQVRQARDALDAF